MTIFRSSALLLAAFTSACSDGRPPANSELGRIVRIENYSDAASQLQRFAEARLDNPVQLRRDLTSAGFKRSVYRDGPAEPECERFDLKTKQAWPSVYFVNLCRGKVFADAGEIAP